jgi:hypothetical protein
MSDLLPPHLKKMQKLVDAEDAKHTGEGVKEEQKPPVPVKTEEKPPVQADKDLKEDDPKKKQPFTDDTEGSWKARFIALQGKYNKEVKGLASKKDLREIDSLRTQLRNASNELVQARSSIVELQNKLKAHEKTASNVQPTKIDIPDDLSSLLSKEDMSYLNDEGIDQKTVNIIGKLMGKISPATQERSSEFEDLKQDAQMIRRSRRDEFWKKFTDAVPDWQEINSSDVFTFDFLHQQIPFAGITWKKALDMAQDNLDADKVISIFKKFNEMQGKEEPAPHQIDPEQLIEPSSTVHTKVDVNPQEKTWTLADAQKVYEDFKDGKISQKEFDKLEAQIWKANNDGRLEKT